MEMGSWVAEPVIHSEKSLYTFWVLSCISVLFGIDCVVAEETDRDGGGDLCLYIVNSLCMWVFCFLHHVSFPVFVSIFCVCCDSFRECEVCLSDVWTSRMPLMGIHSFAFVCFLFFVNREFPFAHHPAWSNHHHHQLPRHPAISPRHHWEIFYDQRASSGPTT